MFPICKVQIRLIKMHHQLSVELYLIWDWRLMKLKQIICFVTEGDVLYTRGTGTVWD